MIGLITKRALEVKSKVVPASGRAASQRTSQVEASLPRGERPGLGGEYEWTAPKKRANRMMVLGCGEIGKAEKW